MRCHGKSHHDQRLLVPALSSCTSIGSILLTRFRNVQRKWRTLMRNSSFLAKKSSIMTKVRSFFRSRFRKRQKDHVVCQDTGDKRPTYKVGDIDTTSTAVDSGEVTADPRNAHHVRVGLITPQDPSQEEKQQSGKVPQKRPRDIAECTDSSASKEIGEADTSRKKLKSKLSVAEEPLTVQDAPTAEKLLKKEKRQTITKKSLPVKHPAAVKGDLSSLNLETRKETLKELDKKVAGPKEDIAKVAGDAPRVSRKRKKTTSLDTQPKTFPPAKKAAVPCNPVLLRQARGCPELETSPEVTPPNSQRPQNINNLSPEHLSILTSSGQRGMLEDDIISKAQELLLNQFQDFDGLQPPAALLVPGYSVLRKAVQIHYDEVRAHWLTTCLRNGKILVADSINTNYLSPSICQQINNIYGQMVQEPLRHVQLLNVDQQRNAYDCGVFSIAFAYEFLADDGDPTAIYQHDMMRNHLISCLQNGRITAFPKRVNLKL